jgi:methionyl-tRNA formyltransferase
VPRKSNATTSRELDIVFMGTPVFARVCLEALLETRHHVRAVVTQPDKPTGRGMKVTESAVKKLAVERDIAVLQPNSAKDPAFIGAVRDLAPDLCVVVAYGRMLPNDLIDVAPMGCINAHASLLPKLRGAAPIQRAILEGYDCSGVTIMRISEEMDAGDMLIADTIEIGPETDAAELHDALATSASGLLVEAVDSLSAGTAVFTEQDHSAATFAPPLRVEEARIDWSRTAAEVDRQVRGFRPRPGAFTFDEGTRLKIFDARPIRQSADHPPGTLIGADSEGLLVACADRIVSVSRVQPEGKKIMPALDYLRGRSEPLPRGLDGER